jgi:hypothetical protein
VNLAYRKDSRELKTGQGFVIKANNPETLLDFELLELQRDLLRVAVILGAAAVEDSYYPDEDDDDYWDIRQVVEAETELEPPV